MTYGGLNWSSQHLDGGGCDEHSQKAFGSVWAECDTVLVTVNLAAGRLARWGRADQAGEMTTPACPSYAGYRFPAEVIGHAVWLYFCFPLGSGRGRSHPARLAAQGRR